MAPRFEWDPEKERVNIRKYGVSFPDAVLVFGDPLNITEEDAGHSEGEPRFKIIGRARDATLTVAYTYRIAGRIRIISARRATRLERRRYEEI